MLYAAWSRRLAKKTSRRKKLPFTCSQNRYANVQRNDVDGCPVSVHVIATTQTCPSPTNLPSCVACPLNAYHQASITPCPPKSTPQNTSQLTLRPDTADTCIPCSLLPPHLHMPCKQSRPTDVRENGYTPFPHLRTAINRVSCKWTSTCLCHSTGALAVIRYQERPSSLGSDDRLKLRELPQLDDFEYRSNFFQERALR